jgi:hypothetical protein
MPTTIKLKNSVTTTSTPTSLAQGEVAINVTDKKVWVGNAATTPVQLLGGGADGSFTNISVSGVATFGAGTVSLPSITTTGDTNTGIFFPAADTIGFTEGGVEALRINSNGQTATSIAGTASLPSFTRTGDENTGIFFPAADTIAFTEGGVESMRIDSAGNVGIGTNSINAKLQVEGIASINGAAIATDFALNIRASTGVTSGIVAFGPSATVQTSLYSDSGINAGTIGTRSNHPTTFITNNAERMRITNTGNVGINISAPTTNFVVIGKAAIGDASSVTAYGATLGVTSSPAGTQATIAIWNPGQGLSHIGYAATGSNLKLYNCYSTGLLSGGAGIDIDLNGNVGIGTTTPARALTVYTTAATDNNLLLRSGASNAYITFADIGTTDQTGLSVRIGSSGNNLVFNTGGTTERMRIDASGNVCINTTGAGQKLNIQGGIQLYGDANTRGLYWNMYGVDSAYIDINGAVDGNLMRFGTANTERMRLRGDGRLMVNATGTASYFDGKVNIFGESAVPASCFKNDGTGGQFNTAFWNAATSGDNIFNVFLTETSATIRGSIDYNRAGGQVRYNTTSDKRLKENIVDSSSALPFINSVKIRSFDWKETGFHVEHGVIAQELEIVSPDSVSVGQDNEDGTIKQPWGVDTATLVPAMIKAIQELKAELDSVKAELQTLKGV